MRYFAAALIVILGVPSSGCKEDRKTPDQKTTVIDYAYKPDNQALYDTIMRLDSLFFGYYNTCDVNLDKFAAMISDSVEFYHDKGGVSMGKAPIVEGVKNNICGKVRRELVPGSLEVYPIKDYGAVEIGLHKFFNSAEPNAPSHPARFVQLWQHQNGGWILKRVISLH